MRDSIQYLKRADIDRQKWDLTVAANSNGLIYSQSCYLDKFAGDWSAIVINDYSAVMPLPFRKKLGIGYHFHPPFIQQLGLIGNVYEESYRAIKILMCKRVKYGDLLLNFHNSAFASNFSHQLRTNFILDLSEGYENISGRYHPNVRRNLNKAVAAGVRYMKSIPFAQAIDLYRQEIGKRSPDISAHHYEQFQELCLHYEGLDLACARAAVDGDGNLLSTAIFLFDNKRVYNLMSAVTEKGRGVKAQRFLLDAVFREFAGRKLLFDFEGSDIPGVKEFYSKFGAFNQPYYLAHYNRMNRLLKIFKK